MSSRCIYLVRQICSGVFLLLLSTFYIYCTGKITEPDEFKSSNWPESTPEEQGVDSQVISIAVLQAGQLPFINGIVIIRNGFLVAEHYYNGYHKDDYHNIRSVSKSFLSALFGIAIEKKYIPNLDKKIMDYFPEYDDAGIDNRIFQVDVLDLLTMHAGIDTDHNNYGVIFNSHDWLETTLDQTLISFPSDEFHYTTAGTHLLSAILTKSTGMSSYDFAQKYLFEPLGISLGKWEKGPKGYYVGGNNMHTSPRNMAKLGLLYLNEGTLNNREIVSGTWVEESIKDRLSRDNMNWGPLTDMGYGYLWWLGTISGYPAFIAIGHGGQFIISIPEFQVIVATVSQSYNLSWERADEQERAVLYIISDYIMPAVIE